MGAGRDAALPDAEAPVDESTPVDPARRTEALQLALAALKAGRTAEVAAISAPFADRGDLEHEMMVGMALALDGEIERAAAIFARYAASRPHNAHPVEDVARLMRDQNREGDALAHAEAAVRLRPDDGRALGVLGAMLNFHFRPIEGEAALRRAHALAPADAGVLNHLGISLTDQGRTLDAAEIFARATATEPTSNVGWTNYACALATMGRFDEALEYYRRSIVLKPDTASIRLNHAICLLKAGRMTQGWNEYEWRLHLPGHTNLPRDRLMPNLDEGQRLDGQIILVTHEEGLGDTLQFMRYLAPLRDRGADVRVWVPETILGLIDQIPGIHGFSGDVKQLVFKAHCPFLSLPRVFSATRDAAPTAPYLSADPALVRAMEAHLPATDGFDLRVGLVWGGAPRPDIRAAHAVDRRRSMGVAPLAGLRHLARVQFVSLQLGPYRDQLRDAAWGLEIHDPMDVVHDMHDTAALMMGLDLVVAVDTSAVHLAAGLGIPTILLDRYDNCWRWQYGRDDSPFYPCLRIIRQQRPFDWHDPIERLATVLRLMADEKRRGRTPDLHGAIDAITPYPMAIPA